MKPDHVKMRFRRGTPFGAPPAGLRHVPKILARIQCTTWLCQYPALTLEFIESLSAWGRMREDKARYIHHAVRTAQRQAGIAYPANTSRNNEGCHFMSVQTVRVCVKLQRSASYEAYLVISDGV